jgi:DUF917 family protein
LLESIKKSKIFDYKGNMALQSLAGCSDLANTPAAITQLQGGEHIFTGKIVNVDAEVRGGFTVSINLLGAIMDLRRGKKIRVCPIVSIFVG